MDIFKHSYKSIVQHIFCIFPAPRISQAHAKHLTLQRLVYELLILAATKPASFYDILG
ncbi:MAG: hypothetical protein IPO25_05720 [Saprospiraceae bacterium]|nr:hypothetical protein [Saprospiraceae bacterium]